MSIRVAPLVLREADRPRLEGWVRASAVRSGLARRARIVLLAAEGLGNTAIAEKVGVSRPTVLLWRGRYEVGGVAALEDLDRPGRPPRVEQEFSLVAADPDDAPGFRGRARSGQRAPPPQAAAKAAAPPPALAARMATTTPAGHAMVPAPVSITKRSRHRPSRHLPRPRQPRYEDNADEAIHRFIA